MLKQKKRWQLCDALQSVSKLIACDWGSERLLQATAIGSRPQSARGLVELLMLALDAAPSAEAEGSTASPSAPELALRILLHIALSAETPPLRGTRGLLGVLRAHASSETARHIAFVLSSRSRGGSAHRP